MIFITDAMLNIYTRRVVNFMQNLYRIFVEGLCYVFTLASSTETNYESKHSMVNEFPNV